MTCGLILSEVQRNLSSGLSVSAVRLNLIGRFGKLGSTDSYCKNMATLLYTVTTDARCIICRCVLFLSESSAAKGLLDSSNKTFQNKKLYRAFCRQANGLTLNIPVFQGLLRVNRKAEKDAKS